MSFPEMNAYLKVGMTSNYASRYAAYNGHLPSSPQILLQIPERDRDKRILLEKEIHAELQEYRYQGEWFHRTKYVCGWLSNYQEQLGFTPYTMSMRAEK